MLHKLILVLAILTLTTTPALARGGGGGFHGGAGFHGGGGGFHGGGGGFHGGGRAGSAAASGGRFHGGGGAGSTAAGGGRFHGGGGGFRGGHERFDRFDRFRRFGFFGDFGFVGPAFGFGAYPFFWDPFWFPSPYPAYTYAPPVVIQPEPQVYVQPSTPATPTYWYYCAEAKAYYPYTQQCAGGWLKVVPTPPVG
jgi:hypothetical protein